MSSVPFEKGVIRFLKEACEDIAEMHIRVENSPFIRQMPAFDERQYKKIRSYREALSIEKDDLARIVVMEIYI